VNFVTIKKFLVSKTTEKFNFMKEYKIEVFKLIQSRELQRMVTNSGSLIMAKSDTNKFVYPLITSILEAVDGNEFTSFVTFLNSLFKPYDVRDHHYGSLHSQSTAL
jgi:hypothetical protein